MSEEIVVKVPNAADEGKTFMNVLRPAMFTVMAAGTATLQARQMLIAQTAQPLGPETVAMATQGLATAFSVGSLVELFVSPIYGQISEKFGRKPLFCSFLVIPATTRVLCVAISEPKLAIPMLWADFAGARFIGLQQTLAVAQTMISDLIPVDEQPAARAQLQAIQSLGQIVGNYASGYLNATAGPRMTYVVTALIPATAFFILGSTMSESHPKLKLGGKAKSEDNDGKQVVKASPSAAKKSPFKTLLTDYRACCLAATLGLYDFMTYPAISTVAIMFMKEKLNWGPLQAGRYAAGHGVAVFAGSLMSTHIQRVLGKNLYVTFAHCSMSLGYLLWGTATSSTKMLASLVPMAFGSGAKEVIMTNFIKRAADMGLGKGEASSIIQAMGAMTRIIAPQLFMRLWAKGAKGSPMILVCIISLLQEMLARIGKGA
jgi:MFS family permease